MLPFKLIYHDRYDLNLGAHVFPSQKFRLIAETILAENLAAKDDFLRPEPASDDDLPPVRARPPKAAALRSSHKGLIVEPGFSTPKADGSSEMEPSRIYVA